jgi:DNA-binding NarL/FixJ family response regulator
MTNAQSAKYHLLYTASADPAAAKRMTEAQKRGKMTAVSGKRESMNVLLVAHGGLFADAFSGSLAKLGEHVKVQRCDPDELERQPAADVSLVVVDIDALSGETAAAVSALVRRFDSACLVALGATLDDTFIANLVKHGVRAYLPKNYSEAQALGLLRVALNGAEQEGQTQADEAEAGDSTTVAQQPRRDRGNSNPYGLTGRELEVLQKTQEGLTNLQIGKRLGMQEGTVKIHLSNAYKKLGVENRVQAIRIVEKLEAIQNLELRHAEQGASVRDWLLPHMRDESHRPGDILFRKGEPGRALYFIQKGTVALLEIDKQMHEGEIFGEIGIFAPAHARTCTARCDSDVRLFCLTAEQARRLYFENPQFAYHVMQLIAQRLLDDQSRVH